MLRAAYDFQAPYENTLSFLENDLFIELKRNNKDQDWLHVVNLKGTNGYAPANYLTSAGCTTSEEIEHINQVLACMTVKKGNNEHSAVVKNLEELRSKLETELNSVAMKQAYELASIVRQNTKCSFPDAQAASQEFIKYLQLHVLPPYTSTGIERISRVDHSQIPIGVRRNCDDSRELDRLVGIVMEVAADQETEVTEESWNELLVLITCADPFLCIASLEKHDCALVIQLVHRLQVETSWRKRKPILSILLQSLLLSSKFPAVAISTVLPAELARDIETMFTLKNPNRDRLFWSVRVLTAVLCSKEWIPFDQRNALGHAFVDCLIRILEEKPIEPTVTNYDIKEEEDLSSAVMNLILALHRQFDACSPEFNPVIQCLATQSMCESLVEKIIILYNREGDPLEEFLHEGDLQINSVSNFVLGLFSRVETSRLFYSADLEVLLDVVKRRLTDYGPGDQRRSNALQLYYAIRRVSNLSYKQHEFAKCMKDICDESQRLGTSTPEMENDHRLVLKIFHESPDLMEPT